MKAANYINRVLLSNNFVKDGNEYELYIPLKYRTIITHTTGFLKAELISYLDGTINTRTWAIEENSNVEAKVIFQNLGIV